ncbi:MAG: sigma-54 dependent transcriptional regulator [Sphingomonas fennica]
MNSVLFVDDDADLRHATAQSLALAGFDVATVADGIAALEAVEAGFDGVVVTDVRMPRLDGMDLLARLMARDPDLPVILISGHADVPMAIAALRQGACDVLEKPFAVDQLVAAVSRALERRALAIENRLLRESSPEDVDDGGLIGQSPVMEQLRRTIAQIAPIAIDVLIQGETGTGKGLVAAMLHRLSRRRGRLVTVDCGALPATLGEAELFGHTSGPNSGAQMPRTGSIEQAHRGTLFLDDIDALGDAAQLKIGRVLEHREVQPVGSGLARPVDLRVVSATATDLAERAREGRFRASLFYRLEGVTLRLPPLRERREDIVPTFRIFAMRAAERLGAPPPVLGARIFRHLEEHAWPGNVRELMRYAENVVLGLAGADPRDAGGPPPGDLKVRVDRFEAELIEEALAASGGDATRACAALGLPRKTFYYKVQRLGIDLNRFRG